MFFGEVLAYMIQGVVLIVNLLSRNLAQYIGSYIAQCVDIILN